MFINNVDHHNKFWSYEQTGSSVRYEWGRIGGSSESQTKEYSSVNGANSEIASKLKDKMKKGYKEATEEKLADETETAKMLGAQYKISKVLWVEKSDKALHQLNEYNPHHHVFVEIMNSWSKDVTHFVLNKSETFVVNDATIGQAITYSSLRASSNSDSVVGAIRNMLRKIARTIQVATVKFAAAGVRVLSIGDDEEDNMPTPDIMSALRKDMGNSASDQVVIKFAALGARVLDI